MKKTNHSEAFKRQLVDEALNRTPSGGFPELEKRHGLPSGLLFDWVNQYGPPSPPAPFSALHFWIGATPLNEAQFGTYFDHAENYWELDIHDIEAADHDLTGCGFSQDLGMKFLFDDDLLLVICLEKPVPVEEMVAMSTLRSKASAKAIIAACTERGMAEANAMFVYADPTQAVPVPAKLFNGLPYIGLFPDPRK